MARGRHDGGLQRRRPSRDPLPLVLVVCEGEVTEPQYIDGFRLEHGATTVRVRIESPGGDPKALVARAAEMRDEAARAARRARDPFLAYDEVWCVLDVDEHARFEAARRDAQRLGIFLAVSNPCFELWLLLHFAEQGGYLQGTQARRLLERHLPHYDKHVRYQDLGAGYEQAVERAIKLERGHWTIGTECGNPSTGVYRLTERIRGLGRSRRP